jgi:hypothetical protein
MAEQSPSTYESLRQELLTLQESVARQTSQLARLESAVHDLCELVTLPESQRQDRRVAQHHQAYERLKTQIGQVVARRRFDALEPLLAELDRGFAAEPDAEDIKLGAWAARDAALADTLAELRDAVRRHVATADWPAAHAAVDAALGWFPDQPEILAVRQQVERTHATWLDKATAQYQTRIKTAADQRQWRTALSLSEELVARFPGHSRTARVAAGIHTLRQNAEIEQRQELEQRLQELIRGHRFAEATMLAERMIADYPNSPQAAECRTLLPRLEAMSIEDENNPSGHPN